MYFTQTMIKSWVMFLLKCTMQVRECNGRTNHSRGFPIQHAGCLLISITSPTPPQLVPIHNLTNKSSHSFNCKCSRLSNSDFRRKRLHISGILWVSLLCQKFIYVFFLYFHSLSLTTLNSDFILCDCCPETHRLVWWLTSCTRRFLPTNQLCVTQFTFCFTRLIDQGTHWTYIAALPSFHFTQCITSQAYQHLRTIYHGALLTLPGGTFLFLRLPRLHPGANLGLGSPNSQVWHKVVPIWILAAWPRHRSTS